MTLMHGATAGASEAYRPAGRAVLRFLILTSFLFVVLMGTVSTSGQAAIGKRLLGQACLTVIGEGRTGRSLPHREIVMCVANFRERIGVAGAPEFTLNVSNDDLNDYLALTGMIITAIERFQFAEIERFRMAADLGFIAVLSAGASAGSPRVRENSTRVLSNIVDNSMVCVPLDYLYALQGAIKPTEGVLIDADASVIRGRANLLYALVPVSSYSFQENSDALRRFLAKLKIESREFLRQEGLRQTARVVGLIEQRIGTANENGFNISRDTMQLEIPSSGQKFLETPAVDGAVSRDCKAYEHEDSPEYRSIPQRLSQEWTIYPR